MKYENLKILSELRDKGSITEEEYQREKSKILNDEDDNQGNNKKSSFSFENPLFGLSQNTFLMIMHISQLAIFVVPLVGIALPIIMWLTQKEINPLVDKQGKEIINFNLTVLIISAVLAISIVGIPALIAVVVYYLFFVIKSAISANNGSGFVSYPLTFQFLK